MLRPWQLEIQLEPNSGKAIYLQIADAIIKDIHSGRLKAGDALPGSRNLAQLLNVNRNTIVEALNVLINEEWVVSRERKGIFVSTVLPAFSGTKNRPPAIEKPVTPDRYHIHFDDGHPDSKIAPITELARAYRQIFNRKARWQMMGYGDEYGDTDFRKAIVQMLNHQKGLDTHEHAICITRGSQMAMYLATQCLIEKGDYVMVENPGYKPAWQTVENAGAKLLPVSVDEDGLIIEEVIAHLRSRKKIKAIYTTPHRQYPTTVTLSLQRRLALVKLSNEYGFTIIEDDYDNEFCFGYRPVLPISSFPELKNYIYIGTMSKVVAPALRIGYLVSNNPELIEKVGALRKIIDVQGDTIMEQAVLQLIKDGTIKRHIRKATHHYKAKRDFTATLLEKQLGDKVSYTLPEGGLAFWITLKKDTNWSQVLGKLKAKGIRIIPPDNYSIDIPVNGLRLSYGSLSEEHLTEGITLLGKYL
ncbi:GntR family transcriptional regulator / MocR family aminotransferase [Chitinophaga sp. YR627]|uniref:MocR-like pyridoxine biosynthesis transcription factor PdxR n=1 Tax=Chitinophaga sp. YR627 TaxID=1881041 RepID=UPI0008E14875|nr:PLP-dependent aminotransferase family protein [Chitinophaga sp. YR627]SFO53305.1 GntR family transcriptional regulator / MocR family aminotransferase [Chitinophaga sp. YR627]